MTVKVCLVYLYFHSIDDSSIFRFLHFRLSYFVKALPMPGSEVGVVDWVSISSAIEDDEESKNYCLIRLNYSLIRVLLKVF